MLTVNRVIAIAENEIGGVVQKIAKYNGKFIVMIFRDDDAESVMDPYIAIDDQTGEITPFSLVGNNMTPIKAYEIFAKNSVPFKRSTRR